MATSSDATAFISMLSGSSGAGPALAQPTISFIQSQITAMLPSQYASAITAQFAGASSSPAPSAVPAQPSAVPAQPSAMPEQPATPAAAGSESAAVGASLAQPTIQYIQAQITAYVPSQYAASILAQFTAAASAPSAAGAPTPPSAAGAVQSMMVSNDLKNYFASMAAPSI